MFSRFRNLFSKNKSDGDEDAESYDDSESGAFTVNATAGGENVAAVSSPEESKLEGLNLLKSLVETEQNMSKPEGSGILYQTAVNGAQASTLTQEVEELLKDTFSNSIRNEIKRASKDLPLSENGKADEEFLAVNKKSLTNAEKIPENKQENSLNGTNFSEAFAPTQSDNVQDLLRKMRTEVMTLSYETKETSPLLNTSEQTPDSEKNISKTTQVSEQTGENTSEQALEKTQIPEETSYHVQKQILNSTADTTLEQTQEQTNLLTGENNHKQTPEQVFEPSRENSGEQTHEQTQIPKEFSVQLKTLQLSSDETLKQTQQQNSIFSEKNTLELTQGKVCEQTQETTGKQTKENTSEQTQENTSEQTQEKISEQNSTPQITEKSSEEVLNSTSEKIVEQAPILTDKNSLEHTQEQVSEQTQENTNEQTQEKISEQTQDKASEKTQEQIPAPNISEEPLEQIQKESLKSTSKCEGTNSQTSKTTLDQISTAKETPTQTTLTTSQQTAEQSTEQTLSSSHAVTDSSKPPGSLMPEICKTTKLISWVQENNANFTPPTPYPLASTESAINLDTNSSIVVEDLPSEITTTPSPSVESSISGSSSSTTTSTLDTTSSRLAADPSKIVVNPIGSNGLACSAITSKLTDIAEVAESLDTVIRDIQENSQSVEVESNPSPRDKKMGTLRSTSSEDWHSRSTEDDSFVTASEGRTSSFLSCNKSSFDYSEGDDSTLAFEMPDVNSPFNMSFDESEQSFISAQQDANKTPTKLSETGEGQVDDIEAPSSLADIEDLHSESVTPTPAENIEYYVDSIPIESETELEVAGIADAPTLKVLTENGPMPISVTPEVSTCSKLANGHQMLDDASTSSANTQQSTNSQNKPNASWRRSKYYENITKQTIKGFL